MQIARRLGATILARTVVNFLYRVDGLRSSRMEAKKAVRLRWQGLRVAVMPLASIIKSNQAVRRPKDLAHLPRLRQAHALQRPARKH